MRKTNCWEMKNCGRGLGGDKVEEFGVCPAADASAHDGLNGGLNAGRYCWRVAGTFCGGEIQGVFATKVDNCTQCKVFKKVVREEGRALQL